MKVTCAVLHAVCRSFKQGLPAARQHHEPKLGKLRHGRQRRMRLIWDFFFRIRAKRLGNLGSNQLLHRRPLLHRARKTTICALQSSVTVSQFRATAIVKGVTAEHDTLALPGSPGKGGLVLVHMSLHGIAAAGTKHPHREAVTSELPGRFEVAS